MPSELAERIYKLPAGGHLCLYYEQHPDEQLGAVAPFIQAGLANGERCVYVADDQTVDDLAHGMERNGIQVRAEIRRGALKLWTRDQWHQPGPLDSQSKSRQVLQFITEAARHGFTGIRFAQEMTWLGGIEVEPAELQNWESTINPLFRNDFPARIICQYNRSRLPPHVLLSALHTHPHIILGDQVCPNPFYEAPLILEGCGTLHAPGTSSALARRVEWMLGQIRKARAAEKDHEELVQRLREAQEQLTQANEELESKVQARTAALCEANTQMEEFAYTVSHDLRAPARSMRGFAVALLEDYGERLDAQGRDFLERIARGGARMGRLIEDILAYSRLGRTEFQLGTVNLDKLVPDIIQQFPEMQLPRAEVAVSYPLGRVVGHDGSMSQAITNLLLNAVKFVAPGVLPKIRVHAEPRGANIRLCVTDNGIGIQPNHQGRLFRVFQRLAVDPSYEGTGMGLAIVKKAAERMGGTVGMQSDGVHGSQFWIEQPAAQQSPVPNATHHTPPALAA